MNLLRKAKRMDARYDTVLSSMCTRPHPIAVKAHMQFIESNAGDPSIFPGTKMLEDEVIRIVSSKMGLRRAYGYMTTGGTESNIQALRAFRNLGNKGKANVVVPKSAHFSFDKAANLLRIELRKAELDEEFRADVGSVERLIDENTIGIVGTAGTTELGQIDPIEELGRIALEDGIPMHVDAAFGGFIIPFADPKMKFDFRVKGVKSLAVDPHKMGMSTIPSGILMFRSRKFMDSLKVKVSYLPVREHYTLTGTRSGASVAATYAVLSKIGWEGIGRVAIRCIKLTRYLVELCRDIGIEPVIEPATTVVALRVEKSAVRKMREKGWFVSWLGNPKAMRVVIMPHVRKHTIDAFVRDLRNAI